MAGRGELDRRTCARLALLILAAATTACGGDGDGQAIALALSGAAPYAPRETVRITASGGTAPYSFELAADQSGGATVSGAGLYRAGVRGAVADRVRVSDAAGRSAEIDIPLGPALSLPVDEIDVAFAEAVPLLASGGRAPYDARIAVNRTGSLLMAVDPADGRFTYLGGRVSDEDVVEVRDRVGASVLLVARVGYPLAIRPASAAAAAGGTLSFGGNGGSRPYRFEMEAAPSGGSIEPVGGLYTAGATAGVTDLVAVVDARGERATAEIAVVAGLALSPTAASVTPLGEVDLTATGGVPPLTWELAGGSGGTLEASGPAAHYQAGASGDTTDSVTVSDAAGASRSIDIAVGPAPRIVPAAWSLAPSQSRDFDVVGGTGPYAWDLTAAPSGGSIAAGTGLYTAGATGGVTDTVRVRDGNGAAATAPVDVGLALGLAPAAPAAGPGCPVDFTASGGQPPYVYSIESAGSGTPSIDGTGDYLAGLSGPATDVVRVTDDAGATVDRSVAVGPRTAIAPASSSIPALSSLDLVASSGGGAPYTFTLTAGSVGSIEVLGPSSVRYRADGGSGSAAVRATDPCGRRATATITVTPATSPPELDYLWPRGAGAGVWLTLVGTGFDDSDAASNTVHFGALEVPAARATPSAVVVRVPDLAASGTVAVSVSTASGGTSAAALDLAYYDGPALLPLVVRSDHTGEFELYLGDTSGGGLAALTDDQGAANASGVISPDGRRVVYVSDRASVPKVGGYTDVFLVDLAGPILPSDGHRNLSDTPTTSDGRPIWHPRGDLVYWWRNAPVVEIRRIDATSAGATSEQVIGFAGGSLSSLAIAPDGRSLFFLRYDGGQRLYRLDLVAGGPAMALNPATGTDEVTYGLSADGAWVYFARGYGAARRTYRQAADADGTIDPVEIAITGAPTLADFDTSWDGADLALQPESLLEDGIWVVGVGGGAAAEVLAGAPVDRVFYLADDARLVDQILSGTRYRIGIVSRTFSAAPATLYDLGGTTGQTLASEGQVAAP